MNLPCIQVNKSEGIVRHPGGGGSVCAETDAAKLTIEARLRSETALSIKAIASRVQLGKSKTRNVCLHGAMTDTVPPVQAQSYLGK